MGLSQTQGMTTKVDVDSTVSPVRNDAPGALGVFEWATQVLLRTGGMSGNGPSGGRPILWIGWSGSAQDCSLFRLWGWHWCRRQVVEEIGTTLTYVGGAVVSAVIFAVLRFGRAAYHLHREDLDRIRHIERERDYFAVRLGERTKDQRICDALLALHAEGHDLLHRYRCSTREQHQVLKSARAEFLQKAVKRMRDVGCSEPEIHRVRRLGHVQTLAFRDSYKHTPALKSAFQEELNQIKAIADAHDTTAPSRA